MHEHIPRIGDHKRASKMSDGSYSARNKITRYPLSGIPKKISINLNQQFHLNNEIYTPKNNPRTAQESLINFERASTKERP